MFGLFIGKVFSAPVKILNAPLRLADKAWNASFTAAGLPKSNDAFFSAPLKCVSEVIEETAKDITGEKE